MTSSEDLPVGPFKEWLERKLLEYRTRTALANKLHISTDIIKNILIGKRKTIPEHIVDKALANDASELSLWDLYPDRLEHEDNGIAA